MMGMMGMGHMDGPTRPPPTPRPTRPTRPTRATRPTRPTRPTGGMGMMGMGGMGMMGTGGIVPLVTLHWDGGRMDLTEEITCLSGAFMIRNELSVPNDELTGISGLKPGCEVKLFEHSQGCRASEDAEDNCDDQLCVTLDSDTMLLGAIASKVSGVTVVCDVPGMGGMGGMGMMGMMGKMGMMGMGGMDGMGMMGKMGMMGMGGMGSMGNCGVEYFYGDAQTGNSCPISDSHVNEADCLAAVEALLPAGQTQGRTNLVAGSWGWVPPGCSVQSHFTHGQDGDWAAHYNRNPAGSNDGGYTPLCEMAGDECGMGMGMGGMGMMGMMGMGMMGMDGMMGMGGMGMGSDFYFDDFEGNSCPTSDVSEADCLDAVKELLPTGCPCAGQLLAGSFAFTPPGCSVQRHFIDGEYGDWVAHYNRNPVGSNDGWYMPVCQDADGGRHGSRGVSLVDMPEPPVEQDITVPGMLSLVDMPEPPVEPIIEA